MAIQRNHYALLLAICASLFSTPLMAAGVNTILPEMGNALHASAAELSLVGTVYSLGLAIFQLACGSLGDIWGHRRIFIFGAFVFAVSSLFAALASSIYPLVAWRFVQGMGGAMLSAAGLALLASAAPPEQRPYYLGFSGMAVYAGIACGPPIAGFLTGAFGWRCIFWANTVTNILVLLITLFYVRHEWRPAKSQTFDWAGCLLYSISMTGLTLACARADASPVFGCAAFAAFAIFLGLFCYRQTKIPFPMLNLSILRTNKVLALSCVAAFINYASFFGIIFFFSFYLQVTHGLDVQKAGLILAFQPLVQAIAQPIATRLVHQWSAGPVSAIGTAITGLGLLASAFLTPQTHLSVFFITQGLLGLGISLFALANTAILLDSAGKKFIGQASGLTGAMRSAGQLVSMAMITFSMSFFMGSEPVSLATLDGFMRCMRVDLIIFGILCLCAIGTVLARNKNRV